MITAFQVGQTVTSKTDAQGLVKGATYTINAIDSKSYGIFGTVVSYQVKAAVDGELVWVTNGHLLLEASPAVVKAATVKRAKLRRARRTQSALYGNVTAFI